MLRNQEQILQDKIDYLSKAIEFFERASACDVEYYKYILKVLRKKRLDKLEEASERNFILTKDAFDELKSGKKIRKIEWVNDSYLYYSVNSGAIKDSFGRIVTLDYLSDVQSDGYILWEVV